jgi:hypothetical protein
MAHLIAVEKPANIEPLPDVNRQHAGLRAQCKEAIERGVLSGSGAQERARAAYLGICLDFGTELKQKHAAPWTRALQALAGYPNVMQVMFFEAPFPAGDAIRRKALEAGLTAPANSIPNFAQWA